MSTLQVFVEPPWEPVGAELKSEEPRDIFEDFDTDLFTKVPPGDPETNVEPEEETPGAHLCPYYPVPCDWAGTSQCRKDCERNPDSFMDPEIKEVFDLEPWSNYCFTCEKFVPSRHHENALDPPEVVYSHTVATGYGEYRTKLSKWVVERLTGK